ncbi:hypothetical protein GBA52_006693 [Prunus armeniaca]|nr:hypothetical protein GBA52_006693 [Prunus armeniaca]
MQAGDGPSCECMQERNDNRVQTLCKLLPTCQGDTCRVCVPLCHPQGGQLIPLGHSIKQIEGCGRSVPSNFKCYYWDWFHLDLRGLGIIFKDFCCLD